MAMEISRSYNPSKSDEAERMKEKQALENIRQENRGKLLYMLTIHTKAMMR